ncbi:pyrroline-5-carboxylate reductase [Rhodococcus sp. D2-41]|uniref:pyrroline-5-carboxylate reductase n=1 Tax=Speluncibacter jeojiensis TaxID=2710754 RepID=UPI0024107BB6|nr:pyrroline-5-carboxylate reductase [Rhodococcus sp. D2-41]MDG3009938.1 pyrroline-5-carboxylate reductase [Rhodococcus sp. D2-41]
MTRIAVIGGGRIGEALISGLLGAGRPAKDLVVAEKFEERARELTERFGIRVTSTADAAEGADIIVVAVKPGDLPAILDDLAPVVEESDLDQLLVSMAAGVPTTLFEARLPAGTPIVRVMPNTPMLVGQGASAVTAGRHATAEHLAAVEAMLSPVGLVVKVGEAQLDAVTAVSGSGPAYFFLVVEAMVDAGVALGLPRTVATELTVQTIVGSAAMLAESDESATELRAAVTSPGGTTAAAVGQLERGGVRAALLDALTAARDRSVQLGAGSQ